MPAILSPKVDILPLPTMAASKMDGDGTIQPSLTRRNSKPSSLRIDEAQWTPDLNIELSPTLAYGKGNHLSPNVREANTRRLALQPVQELNYTSPSMKSPCFVHSQLDKGASLTDWLRSKPQVMDGEPELGVAKSLRHHSDIPPGAKSLVNGQDRSFGGTESPLAGDDDDDDEYGGSLTKQLAETAVGVREMSKQLGRARVRSNIQNILIITKARDNRLIKLTRELALYLMLRPNHGNRGLVVYVDHQLRDSKRFDAAGIERDHPELFLPLPRRRSSSSNSLSSLSSSTSQRDEFAIKEDGQLRYWTSSMCSQSPHLFDFVITLGGDGTVLFTSWLFQRIVPPVLPFALGSLGFLTNFDFAEQKSVMDSVLDAGIRVNLRMRFTCTVYRAVAIEEGTVRKAVKKGETGEILMKNVGKGGWEALEGGWSGGYGPETVKGAKDREIMCFSTRPVETFEVLNDLVVDRGPSPYVSLLELFGDEHHMTTVQADGLTVSTPTGSTAYSLSAGGSLVHPEIPALLITPICPHTLSFRPMLLPDTMELRICVPFNSRSTAWASFDGRGRVELKQGDHIKVSASRYPFPTVCADKQSTDWFHAISRTLKWNERERQKSFVVVEEGPAKMRKGSKHEKVSSSSSTDVMPKVIPPELVEEDEDETTDDDDDKFDIDDSSPEAASTSASDASALFNRQTGQPISKEREVTTEGNLTPSNVNTMQSRKSRSRSARRSGVDNQGRFTGPHVSLPHTSPRQVQFAPTESSLYSSDSETFTPTDMEQDGARDDIHSSRATLSSGRSRIPRDRDVEAESMDLKTPTMPDIMRRVAHHKAVSGEHRGRTFAVWGHDESDSNASDSDQ